MTNLDLSEEALAQKFRSLYSDQFQILVRMHLSFVLDLNTEDEYFGNGEKNKQRKWKLVPFPKKTKSEPEKSPLTKELIHQIRQLIVHLKDETLLQVEGVFRRTGSLNRQNELRTLLNQDSAIDFNSVNYSVHDCASVLKLLLSELSDPLLTESHFPVYCQISELFSSVEEPTRHEKLLEALQLILLLLPEDNKALLIDILDLLKLTSSYESSNKMCPDNLATLFTPHLLCPRKLTAEQLHSNSQNLSKILSFMITHNEDIFRIPQKLLVDFKVRFEKKSIANTNHLNESVNDQLAANTVYTFLDRERTAKEHESNPTETALAQLYAHIQSLPESSHRRKLVKRFNKENGHGTPLQVRMTGSASKTKTFGDSIKKHLLTKSIIRSVRMRGFSQRSSSEEILNTPPPQSLLARTRLFCANCDPSPEKPGENQEHDCSAKPSIQKSVSEPDLLVEDRTEMENGRDDDGNFCLTSTPAYIPHRTCFIDSVFTPTGPDKKSMSPITRSTQRMTLAMQETMMTPRSRKPVLLKNLQDVDSDQPKTDEPQDSYSDLTEGFRDYLSSRDMLTCSAKDLNFSSRTDDFASSGIPEGSLSRSLLKCLDGENPEDESNCEEKVLVLKPKQFDENGEPIVFETSF